MKTSRGVWAITVGVLVFFYIPLFYLSINAFNDARYGGPWNGFTLKWFVRLWQDETIWNALWFSLRIAFTSSLAAMVLGTLAAFALHRFRSRLQVAHYSLVYLPLIVPDLLMGMGLLLFFVAIGVELGAVTIWIAHTTFCLSYVAMVVLGRLQDFDFSLIDAARDLGATPWQATRQILLPLLAPGILAGGLLSFTLSIDDFVITFFVAGTGSTTLPIRVYSMMKHGSPAVINALSLILLIITFAAVAVSQKLKKEEL